MSSPDFAPTPQILLSGLEIRRDQPDVRTEAAELKFEPVADRNASESRQSFLWHRTGILLSIVEKNSETVADAYFNLQIKPGVASIAALLPKRISSLGFRGAPGAGLVSVCAIGVESGLRQTLGKLEENGKFLNPWIERPRSLNLDPETTSSLPPQVRTTISPFTEEEFRHAEGIKESLKVIGAGSSNWSETESDFAWSLQSRIHAPITPESFVAAAVTQLRELCPIAKNTQALPEKFASLSERVPLMAQVADPGTFADRVRILWENAKIDR